MASLLDSASTVKPKLRRKKSAASSSLAHRFRASLPRAAAWILMAASVRRSSSSWACFRSFMRSTFLRARYPRAWAWILMAAASCFSRSRRAMVFFRDSFPRTRAWILTAAASCSFRTRICSTLLFACLWRTLDWILMAAASRFSPSLIM